MCYILSATLPRTIEPDDIRLGFEDLIHLSPLSNPSVQSVLDADENYYGLTAHYCDCGTALGSALLFNRHRSPDPKRQVDKLKRKGWSDSKIERWLQEKAKAVTKLERQRVTAAQDLRPEVERWFSFLHYATRVSPYFGILLHEYRGDIERETIRPTVMDVDVIELDPSFLLNLNVDVIYRFRLGRVGV